MKNLKDFEQYLNTNKGKSDGFPRDINFSFSNDGKTLHSELVGKQNKKDIRRFDPWTFAVIAELKRMVGIDVSNVKFKINKSNNTDKNFNLNFQSLRRRLSFLSINNKNIKLELALNGENIALDNKKTLFDRPNNEIIRIKKISQRSEDNDQNLIEKAFQSFLYGKGLKERTNDRLALLGEDFYQMKGKAVRVLREFPTGVFNNEVTDSNRLLPTEFVDIVTLNKWMKLAVVELKVDNSELEVISQILDYGLFFTCYRNQIFQIPDIKNAFNINQNDKSDIFSYVANNRFHPHFDNILPFYSTKNKNYGFQLRKIVMGETTQI